MRLFADLSEERKLKVYNDLRQGSSPRPSFFLLVAVSTLIAAFGLVMNSTAVVIGAMLVAPLMTPILGLGLGLVRGDAGLIGIALRAEILGVLISLLAGALLGLALPSGYEATTEMLSRTHPNLFDLLVAVLAGLAGAYALVDEKISPVLPGVAISVAIVPPLANSGISLAWGAYSGALGSFLLFFANFLSILLVSGVVFSLAGMTEAFQPKSSTVLARRFGVAFAGFMVVATLLSFELWKMFEHRQLRIDITRVLQEEFSDHRISDLERLLYEPKGDTLMVLADINAPKVIPPRTVQLIQRKIENVVGQPVELFVRTTVTHDVSAIGSVNQVIAETLDGYFVSEAPNSQVTLLRTAEQAIREYLENRRGINLVDIRTFPVESEMIVIAEISGVRRVTLSEIKEMESRIQDRLEDTDVYLFVQQNVSELRDYLGGIRTEFQLPKSMQPNERKLVADVGNQVQKWLSDKSFWLHAWSVTILDGVYYILLEVKGAALFSASELSMLQREVSSHFDEEIKLYVRSELETVVGPEGATSFHKLLDEFREKNRAEYGSEIRQSVIDSR